MSTEVAEQDKRDRGDGKDKGREVTVYVNTRPKPWTEKEITYEQVVALAFTTPPTGENVDITVTYRRGEGKKPEGALSAGGDVKVKDGMIFDVTATDRS